MNTKELKKLKRELELKIAEVTHKLTGEFNDKTGFCVSWVSIRMVEVNTVGDDEASHVLADVSVGIGL